MHDRETQAASERVAARNQWIVGWFNCGIASLMAVLLIALDWGRRALTGKITAIVFLAFLVMIPLAVLIRLKRGKQVAAGWVLSLGYLLLFFALQAFGPMAHLH